MSGSGNGLVSELLFLITPMFVTVGPVLVYIKRPTLIQSTMDHIWSYGPEYVCHGIISMQPSKPNDVC